MNFVRSKPRPGSSSREVLSLTVQCGTPVRGAWFSCALRAAESQFAMSQIQMNCRSGQVSDVDVESHGSHGSMASTIGTAKTQEAGSF